VTNHFSFLSRLAPAFFAGGLLSACALSPDLLKEPSKLVTGSMDALTKIELPAADGDPIGAPIEIYTRVARGAGVCWFGAHGPLKSKYIYHADADPAALGGRSEIVIHEKDAAGPNPRGNRAFRVLIAPAGDSSTVTAENIRFSVEAGHAMTADVRRWARNDLSCTPNAPVKGWDAQAGPPRPDAVKPRKGRERQT
jgi:hypothetical protein